MLCSFFLKIASQFSKKNYGHRFTEGALRVRGRRQAGWLLKGRFQP
jgi:hypothetical protein